MRSRSSVRHFHYGKKNFVGKESGLAEDSDRGRAHQLHVSPSYSHHDTVTQEVGREGMIVAGKADTQKDNRVIHAAAAPVLSQPSPEPIISSPIVASLAGPLTLANTLPPAPTSTSLPSLSTSPSESTLSTDQDADAISTPHSTSHASTSPPPKSFSLPFPPALLAFILVFACFFILMMSLALCRIYGRKRNRAQLASPLFLGTATGLGSIHHRNEAFELANPKMEAREAVLRNEQLWPRRINMDEKINPFRDGRNIPASRTFSSIQTVVPNAPLPVHVNAPAQRSPRRSRVLRPYVARPYHRPHPAYTTDPESVMPLISRGTVDDRDRGANIKDRSEQARAHTKVKEKEKENARPETANSQRKRQRDTLPAAPLGLSNRSLASVTSESVAPPPIPHTDSRIKLEVPSSSSVKSITRGGIKEKDMPSLPTSSTASTAINIGLAMLSEFPSPPIGLGLNLYSQVDPEQKKFQLNKGTQSNSNDLPSMEEGGTGSVEPPNWHLPTSLQATYTNAIEEGTPIYLAESMSSGSKGLAYLASVSSQDSLALKMEERDITEKHMSSTPVFDTPRPEFLEEDPVLADSPEAPTVRPGRFKAPTLPTLSEMALSRADPLYESVTNELFASYGVRMSTASGAGRMSRVSARISRMISWFGDANAGDRTSQAETRMSGVDRLSGVGDWLASEEQRMSSVTVGGVEPLRIGKLRKNPE